MNEEQQLRPINSGCTPDQWYDGGLVPFRALSLIISGDETRASDLASDLASELLFHAVIGCISN